ncbi:hypothetical protein BT63DRAFT_426643 [Microthyrium microscopicum]|uniref:CFEM domain-containing protein n=1 Tax=Microthyrium microscopicum TaxID=703497 RepID=A0A6A6U823_9PEZI|nr:hypothetical protein BT63DRAFT_426643 [Microthyrium microscopicum]
MKSIFPLLFIFFAIILAQESVLLGLIGFPSCSIPCVEQGFASSNCTSTSSGNNFTCICSTGVTGAVDALTACVSNTIPCSLADNTKASNELLKLCASVGYVYGSGGNSSSTNSSSPPPPPSHSTSSTPNSANKLVLGIGLGVGLPVMAIIGALAGFFILRTHQRRKYPPDGFAYGPDMMAQHLAIPQELDARPKVQEMESRPEELDSVNTWNRTD